MLSSLLSKKLLLRLRNKSVSSAVNEPGVLRCLETNQFVLKPLRIVNISTECRQMDHQVSLGNVCGERNLVPLLSDIWLMIKTFIEYSWQSTTKLDYQNLVKIKQQKRFFFDPQKIFFRDISQFSLPISILNTHHFSRFLFLFKRIKKFFLFEETFFFEEIWKKLKPTQADVQRNLFSM